jgi:SAM-dependent methyltransferase
MPFLKPIFERMFASADAANHETIRRLCRTAAKDMQRPALLDIGCDTGAWTVEVARVVGAGRIEGVELMPDAAAAARARAIVVHEADLNQQLPIAPDSFDIVHSNQVIEHVNDVDAFVAEVFRVLKPGGWAIISTENGSSWHNIFAAVLGWQIFSLTNVSGKIAGLGNPIAIQRNAPAFSPTWRHKTIMNYRGLKELMIVNGFTDVFVGGAGYYPLPASAGRIDPRHSVYITVTGRKPSQ